MKGMDRFLIAVAGGVTILVVVAFAIALLHPNQPAYGADDTPEGVVHNYLLASQYKDYARAYGYLSPTLPGYPTDLDTFSRDVHDNRWSFGYYDDNVSLAVEAVDVRGEWASVVVRKTEFYRGDLFDSGQYSDTFEMRLRSQDGAWKLTDAERYWANRWELPKGRK